MSGMVKTPSGYAIVCTRGRKRPASCKWCGAPAPFLCDGPAPHHASGTCDAPMCLTHSNRVAAGRDLCAECFAERDAMRDAPPEPGAPRVILAKTTRVDNEPAIESRLRYWPAFLTPESGLDVYVELFRRSFEKGWTHERGGRVTAAFGDPGLVYRYAGARQVAAPWTPLLGSLRDAVRVKLPDDAFNFALVTRYQDGRVGLGWHSDDEPDLEPRATIASVSVGGGARDFYVRDRDDSDWGDKKTTVYLAHGSLLTMEGAFQEHFEHAVPIRAAVKLPRINITLRKIKTP